jgi:ABC-type transporter Mla subunit MlaD
LTDEDIIRLWERVKNLEQDLRDLRDLTRTVNENSATLRVLTRQLQDMPREFVALRDEFNQKLGSVDGKIERIKDTDSGTNLKTLLQISATIIIPILLALLGGYFALKGAQITHAK